MAKLHMAGMTEGRAGLTDEELFRRYAELRDEDDFSELVTRHQQFAYYIAFTKLSNVEQAEEATQEAFIKLARTSMAELSRYDSFRQMFFGVVRNAARHRQRTQRRYVSHIHSPNYRENALAMSKARNEPAVVEQNTRTRELLERALSAIDEDSRISICMYYLQGMSQIDIANMIGVNQSVISRRIKTGLEALRSQLARAGVSCAVAALPAMLQESGLMVASPSFKSHLLAQCHTWVQTCKQGACASVRIIPAVSSKKWMTIALLLGAFCAGSLWWAVQPMAMPMQGQAVLPTRSEFPDKSWTFDTATGNAGLTPVNKSAWTWVADGGPDGSGCMESVTPWCAVMLDLPVDRFPLQVSMQYQNRSPQFDKNGWALWLVWTRHKGVADFWNIAPPNWHSPEQNPAWTKARFLVTERYLMLEVKKSRHLVVSERLPGARLQLGMQGRYRIDDLSMAPLDPRKLPDIAAYIAALDALPSGRRTGVVEFPEFACPVPGKTVCVKFYPPEPTQP